MKIFFNTSVTGRQEYEENYRKIDELLRKTGYNVISGVFIATKEDVKNETLEEAEAYYKMLKEWITKSDVLVFESSYPSLGVGHEISWGIQLNKPIIVLHVKGKRPLTMEAIPNEKIQVIEYTIPELEKLIPNAIDYATEQMDVRFNFFVSPKISRHLDDMSKKTKVPRAVYLRELIEEDMESNEEYNS